MYFNLELYKRNAFHLCNLVSSHLRAIRVSTSTVKAVEVADFEDKDLSILLSSTDIVIWFPLYSGGTATANILIIPYPYKADPSLQKQVPNANPVLRNIVAAGLLSLMLVLDFLWGTIVWFT
ncbi:hypothetical protein M5689_023064 [Euphorbia peplus]|nr:hypothetical protein M5689_023064 [Euphorbia peplus]